MDTSRRLLLAAGLALPLQGCLRAGASAGPSLATPGVADTLSRWIAGSDSAKVRWLTLAGPLVRDAGVGGGPTEPGGDLVLHRAHRVVRRTDGTEALDLFDALWRNGTFVDAGPSPTRALSVSESDGDRAHLHRELDHGVEVLTLAGPVARSLVLARDFAGQARGAWIARLEGPGAGSSVRPPLPAPASATAEAALQAWLGA
jgi:hypothetical protein